MFIMEYYIFGMVLHGFLNRNIHIRILIQPDQLGLITTINGI